MVTYIALLRGINVSGQKLIKMPHLRTMFEEMGYGNPRTYIQSGNVAFETGRQDENRLRQSVETQLNRKLGYEVSVVLRTQAQVRSVLADMPFPEKIASQRVYVTFLQHEPDLAKAADLVAYTYGREQFAVVGREVYASVDHDLTKSLFDTMWVERKLGVVATVRNWNTVNKLAHL